MSTFHETKMQSDILKDFVNPNYSGEQITLKAGNNLSVGTLITLDANKKGIEADITKSTPDTIFGVLIQNVDATEADTLGLVLARDGIVASKGLTYKTGATDAQIIAAHAQLESKGILVRDSI